MCHFCRGHYGENSCEIIFNLDQWFRRRYHLKKKFIEDAPRMRRMADHNGELKIKMRIKPFLIIDLSEQHYSKMVLTGQPMQHLRNMRIFGESGADPVVTRRTLPPKLC